MRIGAICVLLITGAHVYPADMRTTTVAVLASPDVEAYRQAIDGLKAGLRGGPAVLRVFALESSGGKLSLPAAFVREPRTLVVAMGSEAARALSESPVEATAIYTMALRADVSPAGASRQKIVSTISLDVPMDALAVRLKELFPGKNRVGIIRQTEWRGPSSTRLQADARQAGIVAVIADCRKAEDLLRVFLSLKDKVDFVWCLPDGSLYNSATVQAVLIASLNNRIPVIGFSASFVRAGALLGVYSDFHCVGAQTAEAVQNYLADRPMPAQQYPKTFETAVNQRVTRLLGLQPTPSKEVALFR
jgi:ABC-type uncharacterized transport system substrate-binding protein